MVRKDRTGEEIEEDDVADATDVRHEGPVLPFSPEQAMEISVAGARLTREIALLIKREEKHVKIVTKCREDRKAKIRELIQLWEDHQKGQQRLDFPDSPKSDEAGDELGDFEEGEVWSLIHGGRRVVVKRLAEGSWAAMVDGRLVGDGLSDARSAQEFILADLGVAKQLWSSMKWVGADLPAEDVPPSNAAEFVPGFVAMVANGDTKIACRVAKSASGDWNARVAHDGTPINVGDFPSKAKAQRACAKEIETQFPDLDFPKLEWSEESAPAPADGPNVEYGARVGRKAAVLRQEEGPGKWTGRIGGTPIAVGLPLEEAKRLLEAELTKGKKDVAVEWLRTETDDVTW